MMTLRAASESGSVAICHDSTGITSCAMSGASDFANSPVYALVATTSARPLISPSAVFTTQRLLCRSKLVAGDRAKMRPPRSSTHAARPRDNASGLMWPPVLFQNPPCHASEPSIWRICSRDSNSTGAPAFDHCRTRRSAILMRPGECTGCTHPACSCSAWIW